MEIVKPESKDHWLKLRTQDITSTEISCLFGISPYMTEFELWHRKKLGDSVSIEPNERMIWGSRLEGAIAQGVAEDNKWTIRRMDEYIRDPELRVGASFDYMIEPGAALLEIKNVDSLAFREGWIVHDDGALEAPAHIEMQVQHQMLVSGQKQAHLAALVGGNTVKMIELEADAEIADAIRTKAASFWDSVKNNIAPQPDFTRDSQFIAKLLVNSDPNKILDATSDETLWMLAEDYKRYADDEKNAKAGKDMVKAKILRMAGDASKIFGRGFTISAGTTAPTIIKQYERAGFRNFKINWAKSK